MSVRVAGNETVAALYCSTTMNGFGPVFNNSDSFEAHEVAELFLLHARVDVRMLSEQQQADAKQAFLEWLGAQEAKHDAMMEFDDLAHHLKTGQRRCPDCGDWTDAEMPNLRCDDCRLEYLRDREADSKGDAIREGDRD